MPNHINVAAAAAAGYLTKICHQAAVDGGWWTHPNGEPITDNPLVFSNKLMLTVGELAEAMEGDRKNLPDAHLPHRSAREVELADAAIRLFDLAGGFQLDLAGAIAEKLAYNAKRADHTRDARAAEGGKAY